jgi:hypothetical protein
MAALDPNRIHIVLEYLKRGGKVRMDGRTYVWLDNKQVGESETHIFVIDGLAIEGRKYKSGEDWEDPTAGEVHYMGQKDMSISYFFELINNIERAEMVRISTGLKRMITEENFLNYK